jgi:hypothetical protein
MTGHPIIEAPEQKEEAEQIGLRVPLSLSDPRADVDNKGTPVIVYDIIWNPEVLERSTSEPNYRQLLVELSINYV